MKFASLNHGRDGRLVVVSRDLTRATDAFPVVATLQAALDDWERYAPRLADLAEGLEHGSVPSFRFHEHDCAAPLPRAFQYLVAEPDGLVRHASDAAAGARQPLRAASEEEGIDIEAGGAIVTGDSPRGLSAEDAPAAIRLVMLTADVRLRAATGADAALASLAGFACSPVAVTPDELGEAWQGGRLQLSLLPALNGTPVAAEKDALVDFAALVTRAAATRPLSAGTLLAQRMPPAIAPSRQGELLLRFGDTVRLEAKDKSGHSIFGAIEREILPL